MILHDNVCLILRTLRCPWLQTETAWRCPWGAEGIEAKEDVSHAKDEAGQTFFGRVRGFWAVYRGFWVWGGGLT